jgi:hypothetical protein
MDQAPSCRCSTCAGPQSLPANVHAHRRRVGASKTDVAQAGSAYQPLAALLLASCQTRGAPVTTTARMAAAHLKTYLLQQVARTSQAVAAWQWHGEALAAAAIQHAETSSHVQSTERHPIRTTQASKVRHHKAPGRACAPTSLLRHSAAMPALWWTDLVGNVLKETSRWLWAAN